MKKIYLKVNEKDRHNLRGMPLIHFPDEMDDFYYRSLSNDSERILSRIMSKVERKTEIQLKAMMWFHQDYNPKHYNITFHLSNVIQGENGSRFEIQRELEYHPPKRNGHRRNHAPSELYKDFFDKVAQEDIEKNSPVQTPFGEEYGMMKQLGLKQPSKLV